MRKYYSFKMFLRKVALAPRFFNMLHIPKIISSYEVRPYLSYWREAGRIYKRSFLLVRSGYFFDRDDSLPREDGRTAGSYSTFLSEFFRISNGFFYLELNSVSEVTANASRKSNNEVHKLDWLIN